ncbi:MAG: 30S ribosome-binding factor RbfA [Polyangiales bacterium]
MSAAKRPKGPAAGGRPVRVASRVQEELAKLLSREIRDPRVTQVIVTSVDVTPDLLDARVRFRLAVDEPTARKNALAGLNSASGILRRELGQRLQLRNAPRLQFFYDESIEAQDRIDRLLDEISREPKAAKDDEE